MFQLVFLNVVCVYYPSPSFIIRVRVRVHIKFANITIKCLQGANKLTLH